MKKELRDKFQVETNYYNKNLITGGIKMIKEHITWQAYPLQQGVTQQNAKKQQKGRPRTFWFDKGGAEAFFHVQLGGAGVLGPFLVGAVPPLPAMHTDKKKKKVEETRQIKWQTVSKGM